MELMDTIKERENNKMMDYIRNQKDYKKVLKKVKKHSGLFVGWSNDTVDLFILYCINRETPIPNHLKDEFSSKKKAIRK